MKPLIFIFVNKSFCVRHFIYLFIYINDRLQDYVSRIKRFSLSLSLYFFIYFCTKQSQNVVAGAPDPAIGGPVTLYSLQSHTPHSRPSPSLPLSPAIADLSLLVKCNVVKQCHVKRPALPTAFSFPTVSYGCHGFDSPSGRVLFLRDAISHCCLSRQASDHSRSLLIVTLDILIVTGVKMTRAAVRVPRQPPS